jgi:hypothetical protein
MKIDGLGEEQGISANTEIRMLSLTSFFLKKKKSTVKIANINLYTSFVQNFGYIAKIRI